MEKEGQPADFRWLYSAEINATAVGRLLAINNIRMKMNANQKKAFSHSDKAKLRSFEKYPISSLKK